MSRLKVLPILYDPRTFVSRLSDVQCMASVLVSAAYSFVSTQHGKEDEDPGDPPPQAQQGKGTGGGTWRVVGVVGFRNSSSGAALGQAVALEDEPSLSCSSEPSLMACPGTRGG